MNITIVLNIKDTKIELNMDETKELKEQLEKIVGGVPNYTWIKPVVTETPTPEPINRHYPWEINHTEPYYLTEKIVPIGPSSCDENTTVSTDCSGSTYTPYYTSSCSEEEWEAATKALDKDVDANLKPYFTLSNLLSIKRQQMDANKDGEYIDEYFVNGKKIRITNSK